LHINSQFRWRSFCWQLVLSEDSGRLSVTEDGTLVIDGVEGDDAGEYTCEAKSAAGSAFAKAKLDVRGQRTIS